MKRKIFKTAKGFVNAINRNKFKVIVITPHLSMTFESKIRAYIIERGENRPPFIAIFDENKNRIYVDISEHNVYDLTTYESLGVSDFYIHVNK